jgi:serine phosphatase RsbU (regulator of sigma subunit)
MTNRVLAKLLRDQGGQFLARFLTTLTEPVAVLDPLGEPLLGQMPSKPGDPVPLNQGGGLVGWVVSMPGSTCSHSVAALLDYLLAQEDEKRALAAEVLEKYRELHLLYRLSERLVASLDVEAIGQMAIDEVCSQFQAASAMMLLKEEGEENLRVIVQCDCSYVLKPPEPGNERLIERVIRTGQVELANDLPTDEYFSGLDRETVSLLCAPLRVEGRVFGAILLVADARRPFNSSDVKLINAIGMQTAPAIEIAHLHQMELSKARLERDLQTARRVQTGMLPSQMPNVPGWELAAFWQPARLVSGDLYDFLHFPDGKLGLVVADVTDKGVPAALVMANARSVLRGVAISSGAASSFSPGRLLSQVNDVLCEDMPMSMFVTCLLAVLEPASGRLRYANAGHLPPYQLTNQEVVELRATGLPLGIFPKLSYEEKETLLEPGDALLMYSDGLVEAHSPSGDMLGFPRLRRLLRLQARLHGDALIQYLMQELGSFTGAGWEQEDDITMMALARAAL